MVAKRKKVGFLFSYSEGWIGGTYYFMNLVHALLTLNDVEKPEIVIVGDSQASYEKIKVIGYPYLSYLNSKLNYTLPERIVNKLGRLVLNKNLIEKTFSTQQLDILFGYYEQLFRFGKCKKLFWIPDLQDKYYPLYLGQAVADAREKQHKLLAYSNEKVLFSSNDSKNDFEKFYPNSTCTTYVAPFAVTLPNYQSLSFKNVALKFNLQKPYYISPNQFWAHKNHLTVIKAVEILKQQGKNITVVFTGNEETGGGKYANELKQYVIKHGLQDNCLFLGFIDRKEQLLLMQESVAVIQPSLFEGWSTTVEDAKAMGKHIIMSNLKVHKEQIPNGTFFEVENAGDLANVLGKTFNKAREVKAFNNYPENIEKFAKNFQASIL